jgi:GAF domain-containing protein
MGTSRVTQILDQLMDDQDRDTSLPARLCALCLSALPVSGVAAALMTAAGPSGVVLAATDRAARQLEELQFSLGEGPCVAASHTGSPVFQPDLAATGPARWPGFVAAALDAGIRAIFAFPLRVGAIHVGILDLYRDTPGHLSILQLADALAFADAATVVVLHLQDNAGGDPALIAAIDGRAEVHQATGMITVQLGVGLAEALLRLRAHAYAAGRSVSEVAADVVSRRLRFGVDGGQ